MTASKRLLHAMRSYVHARDLHHATAINCANRRTHTSNHDGCRCHITRVNLQRAQHYYLDVTWDLHAPEQAIAAPPLTLQGPREANQ